MRRILLAMTTLGALALLMVFAVGALADGGHGKNGDSQGGNDGDNHGQALFKSTIAPSVPADPTIHGVTAAGAPWVIGRGELRISKGGGFRLEVKGLVIATTGTNPLTTISASLFCGADTTPTATTATVPFSPAGNAEIRTTITLPAKCLAPIVLLHPNGGVTKYIGASGLSG